MSTAFTPSIRSTFLLYFLGMFLILNFATGNRCYSQGWEKSIPGQKVPPILNDISLLSGSVESHGLSEKRCFAITKGILKMEIKSRVDGDYAMCCAGLDQPIDVSAGDKLLAVVYLEEPEDAFHVKVETSDGKQQVFINKESLDRGESTVQLILKKRDLGGKDSMQVSRFCIAAMGRGVLQTAEVRKAIITKKPRP